MEIEKENANIILVNGSGNAKILTAIKKLLNENLDYKNVSIANAEKFISAKTIVYDPENGAKPFTLDELATKLPASVSYVLTPEIKKLSDSQKTDMILVIGKDLEERYNMEEGTIEDLNNERDSEENLPK
jgi:predicted ATP-binding protein involved in virulence